MVRLSQSWNKAINQSAIEAEDEMDVIPVCKPLQHKTTIQPQHLNLYSLSKHALSAMCEIKVSVQLECLGDTQGTSPRDAQLAVWFTG